MGKKNKGVQPPAPTDPPKAPDANSAPPPPTPPPPAAGAKPKFHFAFDFDIDGKVQKVQVDANTEHEAMDLAREKSGPDARYTQHFKRTENKG